MSPADRMYLAPRFEETVPGAIAAALTVELIRAGAAAGMNKAECRAFADSCDPAATVLAMTEQVRVQIEAEVKQRLTEWLTRTEN